MSIGPIVPISQVVKEIGADYGDPANPTMNLRILGIELHYTNGQGIQEEIGLIPLNVVDYGGLHPANRGRLRVVVHCNSGNKMFEIPL